jgi:hypothetical protein
MFPMPEIQSDCVFFGLGGWNYVWVSDKFFSIQQHVISREEVSPYIAQLAIQAFSVSWCF